MKKSNALIVSSVYNKNTNSISVNIKDNIQRKSINIPYEKSCPLETALDFLKSNDYTIVGISEMKDYFIVLVDEFKPLPRPYKNN